MKKLILFFSLICSSYMFSQILPNIGSEWIYEGEQGMVGTEKQAVQIKATCVGDSLVQGKKM